MHTFTSLRLAWLAALFGLLAPLAQAQSFTVTGSTPAANAVSASRTAAIELQFSQPVDPATWGGITTHGTCQHAINTKGAGGNSGRVTVQANAPWKVAEEVSITVPASVHSAGGSTGGSPATPYVMKFRTAAGGSANSRLFVRFQPDQRVGKVSDATLADVDGDGDLDALAADPTAGRVAVLLNDGTGHLVPDFSRRFLVGNGLVLSTVRCADVDNDGDADVLTCAAASRAVRLNLNDGTGHFGAAVAIGTGSSWLGPMDLCVGDMNADGYQDVTVCDAFRNTVTTCLNDGSGGFPAASFVSISCAGTPVSLSCDDMDNDGDLDVVASCRDTGEIAILLWQLSQWTAGLRTALPAGSNPTGIATGDLDGDGKVDVVVSCNGSDGSSGGSPVPAALVVLKRCPPPNQNLLCNYTATGPGRPMPIGSAGRPAVADVDGDGDLDLLYPDATGTSLTVCRNNGAGSFSDGNAGSARSGGDKLYCWGQNVASVVPGDLDGDGDLDAIAVCTGTGDVATVRNQVPVGVVSVSPAPNAVVTRGLPGVSVTYSAAVDAASLSSTQNPSTAKVDLGILRTSFTSHVLTGSSSDPRTVSVALPPSVSGKVSLSSFLGLNKGVTTNNRLLPPVQWTFDTRPDPSDGTLAAVAGTPLTVSAGSVSSVGDFDGDGVIDVVSVKVSAFDWDLETNKGARITSGTGGFGWGAPIVSTDATAPAGYTPTFVRCADVNGDGTPDAVVVASNGIDSYWAVYTCDGVSLNFTKIKYDYFDGVITDLTLGDLDNDGTVEAIMPTPSKHAINTKGCGSNAKQAYPVSGDPTVVAFAPAALRAESRLVWAGPGPGGGPIVKTLAVDVAGDLHDGEGSTATLTGAAGSCITLADLDGDGLEEAITPMPSQHAINTKGTGQSGRVVSTGAGSSPSRAYPADVDGDGDRDLVVLCPGTSVLWVGLNNGSGVFSSSYTVALPSPPTEAWVGDCDNDGLMNALVRSADNMVRLFAVGPPSPLDLFISTTTTVPSGTYHNITILDGGDATASSGSAGSVTCTGQLMVSSGGALSGPMLFGPGATFGVQPGATLHISDPAGVSADGLTGQFRYAVPPTVPTPLFGVSLNFTKIVFDFKPQSTNSVTQPQVTGTGLPPQVFDLSVGDDLTLTNPTTITGRVTVQTGCILRPQIPAAQLRLRSTPDSTAIVVNEGTGIIQGPVTVERDLSASPVYHTLRTGLSQPRFIHLGSPISTGTVANFGTSAFTPVVNAAFNTSATPGLVRPFPTVQYYDQSRLATAVNNLSAFDKGWLSPAALTDALVPGRGYSVNLPADRKLTCTGPLNNGDITLSLARTGSVPPGGVLFYNAGWSYLANPYPSELDWSLVTAADRPNVDAAMYVFEAETQYTGRYLSYANGVGTADPALAMGQGFWVRVSQGQTSGSLTLRNSQRVEVWKKEEILPKRGGTVRPNLRLTLRPAAGSATALDNLHVYLEAGATPGFDGEYDAVKLPNSTGLNLSATASSGEALSIQGLPVLGNAATVVPLTLGLPAAGSYSLAVGELANFAPGTRLLLRDQLLGRSTLLTAATRYDFSSTATTVAGRFFLDLAPAAAPTATASQLLAAGLGVYPNPARGMATVQVPAGTGAAIATLTLTDALGRTVRTATAALPAAGLSYALPLGGLAPGVYALRVVAGGASAVRRLVVE